MPSHEEKNLLPRQTTPLKKSQNGSQGYYWGNRMRAFIGFWL